MSLSSILDSLAKVANKRTGGPDSLVPKSGGNYENNTFRYPLDVGNYDKGHYILFHVNVQDTTQFSAPATNDTPTVIQNTVNLQALRGSTNAAGGAEMLVDGASQVGAAAGEGYDKLAAASKMPKVIEAAGTLKKYASQATGQLSAYASSISGQKFLRRIRRTTDTVALYMPDSLQFGYAQSYAAPNMSGSGLSQMAAAGQSAVDSKGNVNDIIKNLSPFLLNFATSKLLGNLGKPIFTAGTGLVQNPMMEVMYTSPNLRTFNFTFMFYPRSEQEAAEVQRIIDRFRYHQAPEIKKNSGGYFLIPPSEFDIKFMYFGKENPNIDKISTCVLTSINVDYTKLGSFVTYEVQGENEPQLGRTGMPVGIGLTLSFKETQIFTKEYYNPEGDVSGQPTDTRGIPLSDIPDDQYNADIKQGLPRNENGSPLVDDQYNPDVRVRPNIAGDATNEGNA